MLDGIPLKRIEIGLEKMKDDIRKRSKSTSAMPDVRLAVTGGPRVGKSGITNIFLISRLFLLSIVVYQYFFSNLILNLVVAFDDVYDFEDFQEDFTRIKFLYSISKN